MTNPTEPKFFKPKEYEERLLQSPWDLSARTMLMAHYQSDFRVGNIKGEAYLNHLLWMIDNCPDYERFFYFEVSIHNDEKYRLVKRHWLRAIRSNPGKVRVLENAAASSTLPEPQFAERLLKQAKALEPFNEDWPRQLSHLYSLRTCDRNPRKAKRFARKSIAEYKQALELHSQFPKESYLKQYMKMTLTDMSRLALQFDLQEDAEFFAQRLAALGRRKKKAT